MNIIHFIFFIFFCFFYFIKKKIKKKKQKSFYFNAKMNVVPQQMDFFACIQAVNFNENYNNAYNLILQNGVQREITLHTKYSQQNLLT